MRYIPRLAFITPGFSGSSLYTCGRVMKAPPSIGQWWICGRSLILMRSKSLGRLLYCFGRAFQAARPVRICLKGAFSAFIGSFFSRMISSVFAMVSRNRNLLRSRLPNRFDAARYLEPFTFSNKSAGPCCANTRRCRAAISRYGSTSSLILTNCPSCSRSRTLSSILL
ncbi:hypothetical protein D9M68_831750 [compost metagenome]